MLYADKLLISCRGTASPYTWPRVPVQPDTLNLIERKMCSIFLATKLSLYFTRLSSIFNQARHVSVLFFQTFKATALVFECFPLFDHHGHDVLRVLALTLNIWFVKADNP